MSRISVGYERTRQFLGSAVFRDLSIHPNRDESVRPGVFELDDLVALTSELSPLTGLGGVLLDPLELSAVQPKRCGSQALRASAGDTADFAIDFDRGTPEELACDRLEHSGVPHICLSEAAKSRSYYR